MNTKNTSIAKWSLGNYFKAVSPQQFCDYAGHFKQAAEHAFGTECGMKINLYKAPKLHTTLYNSNLHDEINAINKSRVLHTANDVADITKALWKQAVHVDLTIEPLDKSKAPPSARAFAEFKGNAPLKATFCLQGSNNGESRAIDFSSAYPLRIKGDGSDKHATRYRRSLDYGQP